MIPDLHSYSKGNDDSNGTLSPLSLPLVPALPGWPQPVWDLTAAAVVVGCAPESPTGWAVPFVMLDTLAGLGLAKGRATKWSVIGGDSVLSVLLSAVGLAGRKKLVSDMRDSMTFLGCQASLPSSSFAHFSLSSGFHSLVGRLGISGGQK